jgi:sugar O-acyltransferase (sialic acid O-acetyltransferase NeuD family)
MSKPLIIIGTGGLARECAQLARVVDPNGGRWSSISYVTNEKIQLNKKLAFGQIELEDMDLEKIAIETDVIVGIGIPEIRRDIYYRIRGNPKFCFPNLIHPSVEIDKITNNLGVGNIITKGVVISCCITMGDSNLINWNTTVGHDAIIGSCNVINPGASISGYVRVGDECLIGTGARILEKLEIGSRLKIGAGAVVTKNLLEEGTYVGVPANRLIK